MRIRFAETRDIPRLLTLLGEVLEIHAAIRPDLFVPGTTKYSAAQLEALLADPASPVFVAVNDADETVGYAFCRVNVIPEGGNRKPGASFYLDDLCVDETARGQGTGEALFRYVTEEAKRRGCGAVELNVWCGNDPAVRFYKKMGMRPQSVRMELTL